MTLARPAELSPRQQASHEEDGVTPVKFAPAKYFVVQSGGEWKIEFRNQIFGPYRSRDEALLFAIDAAREIGEREFAAQVLVEEMKDRFLTRWTYGEAARLPAA
jgi:hypothetical protein